MPLRSKYEDLPSAEVSRRVRALDLYNGTTLRTSPEHHDPFMTTVLFTFFNSTLAFSATVSHFLAGAVTALASTSVTPGLVVRK